MMRYLFFTVLAFIAFSACERKTSNQDALYEEVMAVHDEVMPWMQDIMRYKRQIRERIDAMAASGDASELNELMTQLDAADKAMMDWMRNFSRQDYKEMTEEEADAFLKDQKQKVEEVRSGMREALNKAKESL